MICEETEDSEEMAGNESRPRASRVPGGGRGDKTDDDHRDHPLAPFLALVGASFPWLVYDVLIRDPRDFWTWKGLIVLAAVAVGVVLLEISWHFSRGLSEYDS